MDIFGFSTEELFEALTTKIKKSRGKMDQAVNIPDLLERLHKEMANNDYHVSKYLRMKNYSTILFNKMVLINLYFSHTAS